MPSNVKKIAIAINKTIGATCVKKKKTIGAIQQKILRKSELN
jgi:hypothetical protein